MKAGNVDVTHRPRTATEYAYRTVKQLVLAGQLAPGERIDQDEVADRLALSKMPVRSALDKLAAEGLLIVHPHRGVSVSPLSRTELDDIYLVRGNLESLAVRLATELVTACDIAELRRMVGDQEVLLTRPLLDEVVQANRNFHMYIYRMAQRPVLLRIIEGLWDLSERYRRIFLHQPGMLGNSTNDHRYMVDLIASGRADEVAAFVVQHNRKTQEAVLLHMAQVANAPVEAR